MATETTEKWPSLQKYIDEEDNLALEYKAVSYGNEPAIAGMIGATFDSYLDYESATVKVVFEGVGMKVTICPDKTDPPITNIRSHTDLVTTVTEAKNRDFRMIHVIARRDGTFGDFDFDA